jgi:hypothetical protein
LQKVVALIQSPWARRIIALNDSDRIVERPFRSVVRDAGSRTTAVLTGKFDLLAQETPGQWRVVDFKLAAAKTNVTTDESATRYAWQAGIYAAMAGTLLGAGAPVGAALLYMLDDDVRPLDVKAIEHALLETVLKAYAASQPTLAPLECQAQMWLPGEASAEARSEELCRSQGCPHVKSCFGE